MWLNQLKIAIVQKDTERLNALLDDIPSLKETDEIESAIYLLQEATNLVQQLKEETASSMVQIKKNINFLESTQNQTANKLDITS